MQWNTCIHKAETFLKVAFLMYDESPSCLILSAITRSLMRPGNPGMYLIFTMTISRLGKY